MSQCPDCSCNDYDKCLKILNLILDEEATSEQEDFFFSHIESCIVCFSHYNVEKQIRELIKQRVQKKSVPSELALEIRTKIVR